MDAPAGSDRVDREELPVYGQHGGVPPAPPVEEFAAILELCRQLSSGTFALCTDVGKFSTVVPAFPKPPKMSPEMQKICDCPPPFPPRGLLCKQQ